MEFDFKDLKGSLVNLAFFCMLDLYFFSLLVSLLLLIVTTGNGRFAECPKHSAKALPSVTLGKEGSANSASVKPSLTSTFSRALGKEGALAKKSGCYGDEVTETASLSSVKDDTRQRLHLCQVSFQKHSAKRPPGRVPMSGSLPSALRGTRQSLPLCRVPAT
jgi:hypothetical protein